MKKYIVGALFGFLLSLAFSAHAEVASLIGKVVEGSFPLQINGQKSEKDAVVIDGTSYIPVRSAGELFGYDVSFVDSKVILKVKEGAVKLDQTNLTDEKKAKLEQWEKDKIESERIQAEHEKKQAEIKAKIKEEEAAAEASRKAGEAISAQRDADYEKVKQIEAQRQAQEQGKK
jgi:hypothetical protein